MSPYRVIGVCVDGEIASKRGRDVVTVSTRDFFNQLGY